MNQQLHQKRSVLIVVLALLLLLLILLMASGQQVTLPLTGIQSNRQVMPPDPEDWCRKMDLTRLDAEMARAELFLNGRRRQRKRRLEVPAPRLEGHRRSGQRAGRYILVGDHPGTLFRMYAMMEVKLLGATLLHTQYGHWQHPKSGEFLIRPVRDNFRHYPGLAEELLVIRQRALKHEHTIHDQQRIQWLSQAYFGALDIYQRDISTRAVSREDIIEEIDDWFASQGQDLAAALFAAAITGD